MPCILRWCGAPAPRGASEHRTMLPEIYQPQPAVTCTGRPFVSSPRQAFKLT